MGPCLIQAYRGLTELVEVRPIRSGLQPKVQWLWWPLHLAQDRLHWLYTKCHKEFVTCILGSAAAVQEFWSGMRDDDPRLAQHPLRAVGVVHLCPRAMPAKGKIQRQVVAAAAAELHIKGHLCPRAMPAKGKIIMLHFEGHCLGKATRDCICVCLWKAICL